jgi:hypothetical protein
MTHTNPEIFSHRLEEFGSDASLNKPDPTTFYGIGPKGYTDYPVLADPPMLPVY